jgi:hypothetical protein
LISAELQIILNSPTSTPFLASPLWFGGREKFDQLRNKNGDQMIEILFSESEGLTMKLAKTYDPDERHRVSSIGFIGSSKKSTCVALKKEHVGKPIGGKKDDVVYIDMCLDIGDLSMPIDSEYRKELIMSLDKLPYSDVTDIDPDYYEDEWRWHSAQIYRLLELVQQKEAFRFWYSNNPYSLSGFYYVCSLLQDQGCKATTVKLPDYQESLDNNMPKASSWRQIQEEEMYLFLPLEKELTNLDIQFYAKRWNELKEGKSALRVVIDGELRGVSIDYYDDIIRKEIPDGKFKLAKVIEKLIIKYPHGPIDSWYTMRILEMINNGELNMIKKDKEALYSSTIEKKSEK